jgi:hypothetical protein
MKTTINQPSNFTFSELRSLCVRNKFFTCGDNSEYDRLFEMNSNGREIGALADWIWQHSDDFTLNEVTAALVNAWDCKNNR